MPAAVHVRIMRPLALLLALGAPMLTIPPGCTSAGAEVPLDHAVKAGLKPAEYDGRIESIPSQTVVFDDETAWREFWARYKIAPPAVDFRTHAAAATFAGQKPSAGYAIEIRQIRYEAAKPALVVHVRETSPPSNRASATVLTFPYDVVTFPRPGAWSSIRIVRE